MHFPFVICHLSFVIVTRHARQPMANEKSQMENGKCRRSYPVTSLSPSSTAFAASAVGQCPGAFALQHSRRRSGLRCPSPSGRRPRRVESSLSRVVLQAPPASAAYSCRAFDDSHSRLYLSTTRPLPCFPS